MSSAWDMAGERMLEALGHALQAPTYHAPPGSWECKAAETLARLGLLRADRWGAAGRRRFIRTPAGEAAAAGVA